jgi:hypothetical protein
MSCKKKNAFHSWLERSDGKIICHFQSPLKIPTLLLDEIVVAQLQISLTDMSGYNLKTLNPTEGQLDNVKCQVVPKYKNDLQISHLVKVKAQMI